MNYKIKVLEDIKVVGKIFGFDTKNIEEVDYQGMYGEVCKGNNPDVSYGIYEIDPKKTFFTVAIDTKLETELEEVVIPAGEYYEFTLDMKLAEQVDQYALAAQTLVEAGLDFDGSYSFEMMDKSFNPFMGAMKFKYYIKK